VLAAVAAGGLASDDRAVPVGDRLRCPLELDETAAFKARMSRKRGSIVHNLGVSPWFETQDEVLGFIRKTAEDIAAGRVDAYRGGSDLWHTALLVRDKSFALLMPFANATDVLDQSNRWSQEQLDDARREIVDAAKALLDDESFWQ